MHTFRDRVAVITGAASGIGRGLADRCAREGMRVVLADVDAPALAVAAQELEAAGTQVLAVPTDVARAADVARLAEQTMATFGAVHLLCNNAGVALGGAIWETSEDEWAWVLGVNLWGVIHGIRSFVPLLLAQQSAAHIVNTASIAGLIAGPYSGAYKVTKHAVVSLSETLHYDLALRGAPIGVSVLCPGFVQTRILEVERYGRTSLTNVTPEQRAAFEQAIAAGMAPGEVADHVFAAIRAEQFYILPQPADREAIRERMDAILTGQHPVVRAK